MSFEMGTYRGTELAILLLTLVSSNKVSSQSLTLFENTIRIDRDESVKCNADLECDQHSCNKGRVCARVNDTLVQFGTITCDKDSGTPYCNGGLCSKVPLPRCDPSAFACPADGEFPDPANCTRYHVCAQGSLRTNYCPRNTVYDHANGGCKYRRYASDCVIFNCAGHEGRPIVYPRDDRIYGRCVLGKPIILGRCEDYERYDVNSGKCVRYCRTGGVQPPDPGADSCRKYVLCVEVLPRRYEPVNMSCACNEGYDKELNGCKVNATCLETVQKPWCETKANKSDDSAISESKDESNDDDDGDRATLPLIIDNSADSNSNDTVDNADGNLINGNRDDDNSNFDGNVGIDRDD